jgi:hypothetical protein
MDSIVTVVSIALILYALNPLEPCFKRRIPKAKGVIEYESWSSNDADDENEEKKDLGEWKEQESEENTENDDENEEINEGNAITDQNKVQKFPVESIDDDEDQEGTTNKVLSKGLEDEEESDEYVQTEKSDEYVQTEKSDEDMQTEIKDEDMQWHQNEDINEAIEKESLTESESTVSGLDEADEVDNKRKSRMDRISKRYVDQEKYIC